MTSRNRFANRPAEALGLPIHEDDLCPDETASAGQQEAGRHGDDAGVTRQQCSVVARARRLLVGQLRRKPSSRRTGEVLRADAVVASRDRVGALPEAPGCTADVATVAGDARPGDRRRGDHAQADDHRYEAPLQSCVDALQAR